MSKKGFTLVELLGVLVLLSVIVLIAFPNILGAVKSTDKQVGDATITLLQTNARSYANDHPETYSTTTNKTHCVKVETLITEGYTKTPLANVSSDMAKEIETEWKVSFTCGGGKCTNFQAAKGNC